MNTISQSITNGTVKNNDTPANQVFNKVYNLIETEIPFDEKWNNGTGYMDRAINVTLSPGAFAKSRTSGANNRKIILIGTRFGTVVVFERYTEGQNGVFVSNTPSMIRRFCFSYFPEGRLGAVDLLHIFGLWIDEPDRQYRGDMNISDHIESLIHDILGDPL